MTRQKSEIICIGDNIEIMVVDIRGDRVRIGVNAPRDLAVHRKEVKDHILRHGPERQADNRTAATAADGAVESA